MARFATKPSEGTWTEHYSQLGTELIAFEDSVSPEFHELEREAVFKRAWLSVGRVEQLPRGGSYFTKEIEVAKTSVVIVRDMDGEIRAFHNICRHRGNKLVWQDYPREDVSGSSRQFVCKYHGWKYGLDGACTFVQQEGDFFGLDKADFGLIPVHCDVWEGFIFINLADEPSQGLREYLGPMVRGVEGYPFHLHTERYGYRAVVKSNWKLFFDAFQEYYHAPILHAIQRWKSPAQAEQSASADKQSDQKRPDPMAGISGQYYQIDGVHRMQSTGGTPYARDLPPAAVKPIERLLRADLIGPWDGPDFSGTAPGLNPGGLEPWSVSAFHLFPNFTVLFRGLGWYLTYTYWPTSYNAHIFEGNLYFVPAKNARERLAHEMTRATHKEYGLQDSNTLEATQRMLESGVVKQFPLGDHEILVRHLHKEIVEWVDQYRLEREKDEGVKV